MHALTTRQQLLHYVTGTRLRYEVYGYDINLDALQKRLRTAAKKHPAMITVLDEFLKLREEEAMPQYLLIRMEISLGGTT
jgi:hypothetical protein